MKIIKIILAVIFGFTGIGKIWLWHNDVGNDFGLYIGISMCITSIIIYWDYRRETI